MRTISLRQRPPGSFTFDDFCLLTGTKQKADLIDGAIYVDPPESPNTNRLWMWLLSLMHSYAEYKAAGEIFCLRVAFRIDDRNAPEPDIAFVRNDRLHLVRRAYFDGAPDLAMEIAAPESWTRDYLDKHALYRNAGVGEYWLVDVDACQVTLFRLSPRGKYRRVHAKQGVLSSQVLEGFWIRPEWLWSNDRPTILETLQQITGK